MKKKEYLSGKSKYNLEKFCIEALLYYYETHPDKSFGACYEKVLKEFGLNYDRGYNENYILNTAFYHARSKIQYNIEKKMYFLCNYSQKRTIPHRKVNHNYMRAKYKSIVENILKDFLNKSFNYQEYIKDKSVKERLIIDYFYSSLAEAVEDLSNHYWKWSGQDRVDLDEDDTQKAINDILANNKINIFTKENYIMYILEDDYLWLAEVQNRLSGFWKIKTEVDYKKEKELLKRSKIYKKIGIEENILKYLEKEYKYSRYSITDIVNMLLRNEIKQRIDGDEKI